VRRSLTQPFPKRSRVDDDKRLEKQGEVLETGTQL